MQHEARCYCAECAKLDRKRFQGIPGTYQMRLDSVPPAERQAVRIEVPPQCLPADSLPLFVGSLEPTLF